MAPPKKQSSTEHLEGKRSGRPKKSLPRGGLANEQLRLLAKLSFVLTEHAAAGIRDSDAGTLLAEVRAALAKYEHAQSEKVNRDIAATVENALSAAYKAMKSAKPDHKAIAKQAAAKVADFHVTYDEIEGAMKTVAEGSKHAWLTRAQIVGEGPAKLARRKAAQLIIGQEGESVRNRLETRASDPACYRPDSVSYLRWMLSAFFNLNEAQTTMLAEVLPANNVKQTSILEDTLHRVLFERQLSKSDDRAIDEALESLTKPLSQHAS